jgi:tetratricopeptide (TPR) repeat protein
VPSLPHFPKCPSRSVHAHPSPLPPGLSPRQRKLKDQEDIEEKFELATSTEQILSSFKELETTLDPFDQKLGLACLKVGQHLDSIGYDDHEQVLGFAMRALKVFEFGEKNSISVAMALHLVGSVCYNLKRFSDSLGYLNRANRILSELERDGNGSFDIKPVSHAVSLQLANTKTAMGRREEALMDLRKCLEIKETIFEPNSRELGNGYRDLAEAYAAVLNFKEALPLCLKALEIHQGKLGQNSVEVAHDRRVLGVIYTGLEQHDKALEENKQSQKVLKSWGMDSDLLTAELDAANIQISLGKYDEAIQTLKSVVHQTEKGSETRAVVYISMAKALSSLGRAAADSKRCLQAAQEILKDKEHESPESVSEAYVEIASVYEVSNDFDNAVDILKKSLEMIERLPCHQHLEGNVSAKIGWLLLLTGNLI